MKHIASFNGRANEQFSRLGLPENLKTEQPVDCRLRSLLPSWFCLPQGRCSGKPIPFSELGSGTTANRSLCLAPQGKVKK
jgi:hypothetical protein